METFTFRDNPFKNLTDDLQPEFEDCHIDRGYYRLCKYEKEIRNMIKRNKFGYERVSSVETTLKEFIAVGKGGQLSFCLKDSFERLLIHILCRYYGLDSYSK